MDASVDVPIPEDENSGEIERLEAILDGHLRMIQYLQNIHDAQFAPYCSLFIDRIETEIVPILEEAIVAAKILTAMDQPLPRMTVQNLIKRIEEGFDLPAYEGGALHQTIEALNEACGLLNDTLERGEHQFGHLRRLVELLETDLRIVDNAGEKEPEAVFLPTLELLRGVIQQQTSVLLEHKARLKQLMAELSVRPEGALVDALMLYFSRLFAATKDTAWIEQQEEPEHYTERLVEGMLPSQSIRFLSGEGQLMLGKFTGNTTSWLDMKARLEGHQYWISELFSTFPSGHALAQPLLLMMQATERRSQRVDDQILYQRALVDLERIGSSMSGVRGSERVFSLEKLRLEALMVYSLYLPWRDVSERQSLHVVSHPFGLHFALGLVAYIERRMKPLYALLQLKKIDTCSLTSIARHYESIGIRVPTNFLSSQNRCSPRCCDALRLASALKLRRCSSLRSSHQVS